MGRLVLNGKSYTGDESNGHLYGEDPPRAEQGVEGSMYIQYTATKEEDEEGHIIKVPNAIVAVYSKIDGQWMIFNDTEVPETHYYSWVIPNPPGGAIASLTKVNIDGDIYSIDAAGSEVIPNKQGTPSHDLDQVEIDGVLYLIRGLGTPVEANPQDTASTNLSKIKIDGTAYNVVGTEVEANPSGTATTDLTKLNVDGTIYSIPEGGTEVEANPAGAATATLGKLGVDNTIYSIPVGSTVVANPSSGTAVGTLTRLDVDGDIYNIDSGSSGSEVEGNPSGAATVILHKLGIDGTIYSVDDSGSEVEANPAGEATDVLNKLSVDGTIYSVGGGGGGSSTLAGLDDVGITTLSDGQLLVYDDTNDEWVNGNIAGVNVQPVIYSTEEREIGVWTDGKPLYQKMLIFTAPSSSSYTQQPLGISGYDSIIIDYSTTFAKTATASTTLGMYGNGTVYNDSFIGLLNVQANTLDYRVGSSYYGATIYLTLLYTKTTDTPGAGTWTPSGVPAVHYSTDEQVVGTWIDGSTLYERTYSIASVPQSTSYSFENDASDIIPHSFNGVYTDNATRQIPNLVSSNPIVAYKYNNKLTIQNSSNNILTNVEITVRYTKTTS